MTREHAGVDMAAMPRRYRAEAVRCEAAGLVYRASFYNDAADNAEQCAAMDQTARTLANANRVLTSRGT